MAVALRQFVAVLLRRGWVLPLAVVGITAIVVVISRNSGARTSVAEAVVLVSPGAKRDDPGQALQAVQLANTYAASIPQDDGVIGAVARSVGRSPDDVAARISAVGTAETSVIHLRYSDTSDERAKRGAVSLAASVTGPRPESFAVGSDVVREVRRPRVVAQATSTKGEAIVIGVFLGIALGGIIMIAWERSDPRLDRADQLTQELGSPALNFTNITEANIKPLLDRWLELARPAPDGRRTVVGVVAGSPKSEGSVGTLVERLQEQSRHSGYDVAGRDATLLPADRFAGAERGIELVAGGMPGRRGAEAVARSADLVVLAVSQGARAADVRQSLRTLEEFGAEPLWALLYRDRDLRVSPPGKSDDHDSRQEFEPAETRS
jgi:capsular polysaccharide biosynthesis protein